MVIYSFHMPFFMYLSGFVMMYTFRPMNAFVDYRSYVGQRFFRLAPAFAIFGLVILAGKIVTSKFLHVDNQPVDLFSGILDILLVPGESAAKGLWFVYVLFEYYLLVPVLLFLFGARVLPIILVALVLYFMPSATLFMLDGAMEYFIYFSIGMLVARQHDVYADSLDRYRWVLLVLFVSSFSLLYTDLPYMTTKLIIGCMSIPAVHALVRIDAIRQADFLAAWGVFSFAIYLMNTIFIGLAKGLVFKVSSWDGPNFLWVMPLLLVCGFFGPILTKKYFFRFVPPLDRITD